MSSKPSKQKRPTKASASLRFSYCIGRPWPDLEDGVCVYSYHTEVHHGTMAEAEGFRKYAKKQTGKKHFIYKLVEI